MNLKNSVEKSSGNVFKDLGIADHEELLAKAEIARQIGNIIKKRRMSQVKAAKILGLDQPKVSYLIRGKLTGFSIDRLFRLLNALGKDVEIIIKTKPRSHKQAMVSVVATR